MTSPDKNIVREAPQAFDPAGAKRFGSLSSLTMIRAKVFRSGNSLALRLPKALGLSQGMEMDIVVAADGSLALRPVELPRRKIDISGFAGKAPGIKLAPREDFEERPSTIAAREAARKAAEQE
jgi:antitoxin VapB